MLRSKSGTNLRARGVDVATREAFIEVRCKGSQQHASSSTLDMQEQVQSFVARCLRLRFFVMDPCDCSGPVNCCEPKALFCIYLYAIQGGTGWHGGLEKETCSGVLLACSWACALATRECSFLLQHQVCAPFLVCVRRRAGVEINPTRFSLLSLCTVVCVPRNCLLAFWVTPRGHACQVCFCLVWLGIRF